MPALPEVFALKLKACKEFCTFKEYVLEEVLFPIIIWSAEAFTGLITTVSDEPKDVFPFQSTVKALERVI